MSLSQGTINGLNLAQCIVGCVFRFGFVTSSTMQSMTWEQAASLPSEDLRWLIFPWGEPANWPDGPFTVICGMTQAAFVAECLSRASLSPVTDETAVAALKRCLAA